MKNFFRNSALTSLTLMLASSSAFAADCPTTIREFFNSVQRQGRDAYVQRTSNSLWETDNIFRSYSDFNSRIHGSAPNRSVFDKSPVTFLNDQGEVTRTDLETVTITENGSIKVILNSWNNTARTLTTTHCDAIGKDQILIQATSSSGTRKTIYNFTLIKTTIVD